MKRFIILLLLFTTIGFTAFGGTEVSDFTNAKLFAEDEDFSTSYKILTKFKNKTSEELYFMATICEKLEKYNEALDCYKKIIEIDKNNIKSRLSIIKLYLDSPLKNELSAKKEMDMLYADNKDEKIRVLIDKLRNKTLVSHNENNFFESQLSLNTTYNDNITSGTDKKMVTIKEKEYLVSDEQMKKSDTILNINATAGYKLINNKDFLFEPVAFFCYDKYLKYSQWNKLNIATTFFSMFKLEAANISFPIGAATVISENHDKKQAVEELSLNSALNININFGKTMKITPHLEYSNVSNYKEDYKRQVIALGIGEANSLFQGTYSTDISICSDVNSNNIRSNKKGTVTLGYNKEFSKAFETNLRYSFEYKIYDQKDPVFQEDRKEQLNTFGVDFTYKTELINILAGYEYDTSNSLIDLYDYNVNKVKIGLYKSF